MDATNTDTGLAAFHADTAKALATFSPADAAIADMANRYLPLTIAGIDDRAGYQIVRAARLDVKRHRVAIEKTRKALKDDALEYGRRIDDEAWRLTEKIAPIEEHLERQEKAIDAEKERIKAEFERARKAKLDGRVQALAQYGVFAVPSEVEPMTDEAFAQCLKDAAVVHAAEVERKRLEAEEASRKAQAEAAAKRAEEARLAEERRQEQAKLAAERAELERQRREQVEAQIKLNEEAAALERSRREAFAQDEERKARLAREAKEAQEQAERDARRPDAEKLRDFISRIEAVWVPELYPDTTAKVIAILDRTSTELRRLADL